MVNDIKPLYKYMNAKTIIERDAAFLEVCAEKIREGTFQYWDIPNTIVSTFEDIAKRLMIREKGILK